jgi:hypothetical protein
MEQEMKRVIRADDFEAEWLEKRAKQIPQGPDADHYRKQAEFFRKSGRTGMVRVREMLETK